MRACFTLLVHDEVQGVQRVEKKKEQPNDAVLQVRLLGTKFIGAT